jgi:DNA helicase-2/ATP-dependent DNA helicase PcrA
MAVTFTNKAAKEMLTRLGAMLPVPVRGMWIGTFHGLCNRFLRAHWKLAALPQGFQILDSSDQLSAVKRVIKAMNLDEERFVPKQVTWFIAGAEGDGLRPQDVEVRDEQTRVIVQIYEAYEAQCQREGVVDFAELMLRTYELMRDNARCASTTSGASATCWSTSSRTPTAAVRVAQDVRRPADAVFAVGDDDQSIYAFRGAQVGNMALFEREFGVEQVIKLERNYRSFGNILDAANELISNNQSAWQEPAHRGRPGRAGARGRGDQRLRRGAVAARGDAAAAPRGHGARRHRAAVPQQRAEPRARERAVQRRHSVQGVWRLALLRACRGQARVSYCGLIENPSDDTSFIRVVNFPARGIGASTIEQLQDAAKGTVAAWRKASVRWRERAGPTCRPSSH